MATKSQTSQTSQTSANGDWVNLRNALKDLTAALNNANQAQTNPDRDRLLHKVLKAILQSPSAPKPSASKGGGEIPVKLIAALCRLNVAVRTSQTDKYASLQNDLHGIKSLLDALNATYEEATKDLPLDDGEEEEMTESEDSGVDEDDVEGEDDYENDGYWHDEFVGQDGEALDEHVDGKRR